MGIGDWVERGDAMRGLASTGLALVPGDVHALLEHSNRGKLSLGLDSAHPKASRSSTSSPPRLTCSLPTSSRACARNSRSARGHPRPQPRHHLRRGTGQGERGPDADKGSYDSLAFWTGRGVAVGAQLPSTGSPVRPAPGFGDSIGAMTIAGGIMGALFHRERTGEATMVDVSLLGVGHVGHGSGGRPLAGA